MPLSLHNEAMHRTPRKRGGCCEAGRNPSLGCGDTFSYYSFILFSSHLVPFIHSVNHCWRRNGVGSAMNRWHPPPPLPLNAMHASLKPCTKQTSNPSACGNTNKSYPGLLCSCAVATSHNHGRSLSIDTGSHPQEATLSSRSPS